MKSITELDALLTSLDRRPYSAYKRIRGGWAIDQGRALFVDHVQADPFARPSRVRLQIAAEAHGHPRSRFEQPARRIGLCDLVLRRFAERALALVRERDRHAQLSIDIGGAAILERSAAFIDRESGTLELRLRVGLPARGRSVLGQAAATLLAQVLPEAARAVDAAELDEREVDAWCNLVEDHAHLQRALHAHGLIAFVRDGSVLPRARGDSQSPLPGAVPFESPPSLRVELDTLHHGRVRGMGIGTGVTLVTGGGFHGKTTLLDALEKGIVPHVPGDGREWVVTRADAVKVRSEDGRSIAGVDLSPFVGALPGGVSTREFSTHDASGSTSLAASIVESLEIGARVLLMDEDTCATNLLIRDARMQRLIERETIVPLVDRVRALCAAEQASVVLVLGGSGDYLEVADRVLLMESFRAIDATARAAEVVRALPVPARPPIEAPAHWSRPRVPLAESFDARKGEREKVQVRGRREIVFGHETLDLSALEQLVDDSQARTIGILLREARRACGHETTLVALVERLLARASAGLHVLEDSPELAMIRPFELAAAINRLRSLRVT